MGEFDDKGISKVFFTNFRCKPDEGPVDKLKRLIKSAGFGDVDMDGLVGASDADIVSYYEANYMGIDTLAQFMAGDLDGDAWPTAADGDTMSYYEANYMGMPMQSDVAAMASFNIYELI